MRLATACALVPHHCMLPPRSHACLPHCLPTRGKKRPPLCGKSAFSQPVHGVTGRRCSTLHLHPPSLASHSLLHLPPWHSPSFLLPFILVVLAVVSGRIARHVLILVLYISFWSSREPLFGCGLPIGTARTHTPHPTPRAYCYTHHTTAPHTHHTTRTLHTTPPQNKALWAHCLVAAPARAFISNMA